MQRIMAALRIMIEREIGIFHLNNIPKPTAAPVPSGSLSNIIGTGENFVKLESPDINYFFYFWNKNYFKASFLKSGIQFLQ